jgi:MFS family permease
MSSQTHPRRRLALVLIAAAQFMVIMDTSIIGVALPHMQAELGFSQENLSWVFNAYVVAFGGLLLLGGRLADLLGARRVFAAGWATRRNCPRHSPSTVPAGGTGGVFLGGVITEYISWPWVF